MAIEKDGAFYYGSTSAQPKSGVSLNEVPESLLKSAGWEKKSEIEFSRYKQDCRKRAIEMAHMEILKNGSSSDDEIIGLADKYYNWLISIPQ